MRDDMQAEIDNLSQTVMDKEGTITMNETTIRDLRADLAKLTEECSGFKAKEQDNQDARDKAENDLMMAQADLEKERSVVSRLRQELKEYGGKASNNRHRALEAQDQVTKLEEVITGLERDRDDLRREVEQSYKDVLKMDREISAFEGKADEKTKLERED